MSLKFSGKQKIVLWLGAALCLWQAIRNEDILEAALLFVAAGIVPGTQIKLSPDTVLVLLPIVFGLIVLLVFWSHFMRLCRVLVRAVIGRNRSLSVTSAYEPQEGATLAAVPLVANPQVFAEPLPEEAAAVVMPATAPLPVSVPNTPDLKESAGPSWLGRFAIWLAPRMEKWGYRIGFAWGRLSWYAGVALRITWRFLRFSSRVVRVEARNFYRLSLIYALRFWRWVLPYLREFDDWLGRQVQRALRHPQVRHIQVVLRAARETAKEMIINIFKK